MSYHLPVMLRECLDGLRMESGGVYVDATYGGGGHSKAILAEMGESRLLAFDQDADALEQLIEDERLVFIPSNFRYIGQWLDYLGIDQVDGVLADLGVSSHQLDEEARGFTYRSANTLDMRMNQDSESEIWMLLNEYSVKELQEVLGRYGELRNARTLAVELVKQREKRPFDSAESFLSVVHQCVRGDRNRYLAQVYQAFRIELNDEMKALDDFLNQLSSIVRPGGRLVVMSYHSLEDRRVKNLIKKGNAEGKIVKDDFGNIQRDWKEVVKGVVSATPDEINNNSRARSAKLRIAERK